MMILPHLRTAALAVLMCALPAAAQEHPAIKFKVNIPPSADLSYAIKSKQSGIPLDGESHVKWSVAGGKFTLSTESRAMLLGKILEAKTEGRIDDYGLAPISFTEKRIRKDAAAATFDRDAKTISFNGSTATYPIKGGEQDRNSAIWQLISVARAAPAKFKADSEWNFFVVGPRDADPWTFKVRKYEKIKTPLGELNTAHLVKVTAPGKQLVDIWLAPSLEWYPVRLRYTDPDGDYIEQMLVSVVKKP